MQWSHNGGVHNISQHAQGYKREHQNIFGCRREGLMNKKQLLSHTTPPQ